MNDIKQIVSEELLQNMKNVNICMCQLTELIDNFKSVNIDFEKCLNVEELTKQLTNSLNSKL